MEITHLLPAYVAMVKEKMKIKVKMITAVSVALIRLKRFFMSVGLLMFEVK